MVGPLTFASRSGLRGTLLVILAAAVLVPTPAARAEGERGGTFDDPVFGSFTKVYRKAESAVVGVRATQGAPTGIRERFREANASSSGTEVALNVVRLSLSLPFYLAQSALSSVLDPLAGTPTQEAVGSGFVIDRTGLVLTNEHVVAGADRIEVRFSDDRRLRATVVAIDPAIDVALLRLPADVPGRYYDALTLAPPTGLTPGQWVMAIGSSSGLDPTVTVGVVSAPSRHVGEGRYDEYIEIDATVPPDASGGPLFDGDGEVIGINTAAVHDGAGTGFALPIQAVRAVIDELRAGREPRRGEIGLRVAPARAEEFARFGLAQAPGLWIRDVADGSPAEQVGVEVGDLLIRLAYHQTKRMEDFDLAQRDLIVDQATSLTVWRAGKVLDFRITPVVADEG